MIQPVQRCCFIFLFVIFEIKEIKIHVYIRQTANVNLYHLTKLFP